MKKFSLLALTIFAALIAFAACAGGAQDEEESGYALYFLSDLDSSGGGDAIAASSERFVPYETMDTEDCVRALMERLLAGPDEASLRSPIPDGTTLHALSVSGRRAEIDLSAQYARLSGIDLSLADYCITLSLMQLDGIYAVRLTVAGELPADRTSEVYTSEEVLLTSPDDVVRTVKVQLYFPDGGGTLVGEERRLTVYEGETVAQAVVKALTERPLDSYADLYPLLPEGFTALNASTEEGICYLNLPGSVAALLPEDAEAQNRMIQGLVDSLCSLEDVTQVQLMLDGEYQLMLGSVPISRPILPTGGVQPTVE